MSDSALVNTSASLPLCEDPVGTVENGQASCEKRLVVVPHDHTNVEIAVERPVDVQLPCREVEASHNAVTHCTCPNSPATMSHHWPEPLAPTRVRVHGHTQRL